MRTVLSLLLLASCGARTSLSGSDDGPSAGAASDGGGGEGGSNVAGGGVGGDAPWVSTCVPGETTTVVDIAWPIKLLVADGALYAASLEELGTVSRVDQAGSTAILKLGFPHGLASDGQNLFVAASGDREILKSTFDGQAVTRLAGAEGPTEIDVDATDVLVADYLGDRLLVVGKNDGEARVFADNQPLIYRVAFVEDQLVWTTTDGLFAMPRAGGDPRLLLDTVRVRSFAYRAPWIYVVPASDEPVYRVALDGTAEVFATPAGDFFEGAATSTERLFTGRVIGGDVSEVISIDEQGNVSGFGTRDGLLTSLTVAGNCVYAGYRKNDTGWVERMGF